MYNLCRCGFMGPSIYNVTSCCNIHSTCYSTCNADQDTCGGSFRSCMINICDTAHPGDSICTMMVQTYKTVLMGCTTYLKAVRTCMHAASLLLPTGVACAARAGLPMRREQACMAHIGNKTGGACVVCGIRSHSCGADALVRAAQALPLWETIQKCEVVFLHQKRPRPKQCCASNGNHIRKHSILCTKRRTACQSMPTHCMKDIPHRDPWPKHVHDLTLHVHLHAHDVCTHACARMHVQGGLGAGSN